MKNVIIHDFPALGYACNEAVNTLCTNMSFSGEGVKKIMLTSCESSEGKTFLAMNILRTMVGLGKKVALVDADLRRSTIASRYSLEFAEKRPQGLAHYLAGMAGFDDVCYSTNIPNAYIVPVGREVTNSLALLASRRFGELLDEVAKRADYVIVDTPPLGAIIDAAEIAKSCDGAMIVVSYDRVHHHELIDVTEQLTQTGCPILGVVLNNVKIDDYLSKKYYYKSYYSKSYYAKDKSKASDKQRKKKNKS